MTTLINFCDTGAYDTLRTTKLIRKDDGHHIQHDVWCGGGIEGETYRPHTARVSNETAARLLESWDGDRWTVDLVDGPYRGIDEFLCDMGVAIGALRRCRKNELV